MQVPKSGYWLVALPPDLRRVRLIPIRFQRADALVQCAVLSSQLLERGTGRGDLGHQRFDCGSYRFRQHWIAVYPLWRAVWLRSLLQPLLCDDLVARGHAVTANTYPTKS